MNDAFNLNTLVLLYDRGCLVSSTLNSRQNNIATKAMISICSLSRALDWKATCLRFDSVSGHYFSYNRPVNTTKSAGWVLKKITSIIKFHENTEQANVHTFSIKRGLNLMTLVASPFLFGKPLFTKTPYIVLFNKLTSPIPMVDCPC